MLINLSRVVAVAIGGGTALWWYGIPRVEYPEVLLCAQQASCDGTLEYFIYLEVPKMSFGEESTRTNQPNFPPQRFLTNVNLTARMSRQTQTKWWVGLKMDLKKCLAEKVANMLATCCHDSQMSAHFAQMPLSRWHNFDPNTFFCVGIFRHPPNFPL